MIYQSTRGIAPELGFKGAVMEGLARDGGLYLPKSWPAFGSAEIANLCCMSYSELATRIIEPFLGGDLDVDSLSKFTKAAYAAFTHQAVAPLIQIGEQEWVLELFHGPTLAFKDFALQLLGLIFDHFLAQEGRKITIVGATSGDTGSAAIAGCRGRKNIEIFILHPQGKVSEVQRRMMTTVDCANVHNIAIEGTFDDCQNIVKEIFSDLEMRDQLGLAAINSINWARIVAQVAYYFYAALALGAPFRDVGFAVPTGNFGDVYAGFVAKQMGLPIASLVIGTNQNDIIHRCLTGGEYRPSAVNPSISPSIDIQIASNFERILFEVYGRDASKIRALMDDLKHHGGFVVERQPLQRLRSLFASSSVSENETRSTIASVCKQSGYLVDPHTAVGITAGRRNLPETKSQMVYLATAHPAKFPDAVKSATGDHPRLPAKCADLYDLPEKYTSLPANIQLIKDFIASSAQKA